jgi:hypothetical protein
VIRRAAVAGRHANGVLLAVCLVAGVVAWLPFVAGPWQTLLSLVGVTAGVLVLRRLHGICRACGHPGSWSDPLTVARRPRVHVRHLPAIRESRRASGWAAGGALTDRLMSVLHAREDRRWLDTPAGCCECGTGGPYYRGDGTLVGQSADGRYYRCRRRPVTRYLYAGATAGGAGRLDWSACSEHPCPELAPLVDYGTDVVVTFRRTEADAAAALAARDAAGGAS